MNQMDQDEKLIIEVQQYPGLYDQSSVDYRDLRKKESMWQAVAESLSQHARECQARWRVLRDKFVREMRKNMNPKRAGAMGSLQVYQGSWPLMSPLMFLTSHVKHRPYRAERRDTYNSDAGVSEEEDEVDHETDDEETTTIESKHNPNNNNNNKYHHHNTTNTRPSSPNNSFSSSTTTSTITNNNNNHSNKRQRTHNNNNNNHNNNNNIPHPDFYQTNTTTEMDPMRLLGNHNNNNHNHVGSSTTSSPDETDNGDRLFCLSLVSVLKRLEPEKRSLAKIQIQRLLHNLEFPQVKVEL